MTPVLSPTLSPTGAGRPPAVRARLGLAVAVAALVHGWLLWSTAVPARDGVAFARGAAQLDAALVGPAPGDPPTTLAAVLRGTEHPPGYPFAVWLAWQPVRAVSRTPVPDQLLFAAGLASLAAGVGLAVVHYRLARAVVGPAAGAAAAVLFQVLPVPARVTADTLSEGLALVGVGAALALGVRAARGHRPWGFVAAGAAAGGAYLVRPEGLLAAAAVGLAVLARTGAEGWRPAAGRLALLGLGVAVVAGPYMAVVGGVTNKPTGRKLLHRLVGELPAGAATPGGPPLAAWYVPAQDGAKACWVATTLGKEGLKAFHYLPAVLAVAGAVALRRRFRAADPRVLVPAGFAGLHLALLVGVACGSEYLSERHVLPVVFVGCVFAAAGARVVGQWAAAMIGRPRLVGWATAGVVGAFALTAAPALSKPLHPNRAGHRAAGRWLAAHAGPVDAVIDPFDWAQFYAGRTVRYIPADPTVPAAVYAVVEAAGDRVPNSKLPKWEAANRVAGAGRAVFRWPAGPGEARVVVYRLGGE